MADNLGQATRVPSLPLPPRYVEVDVLRGLAAFWVVLSHYLPYWNRYLGPAPTIMPEEGGVYAVKLFFVISGFAIFMTLDRCKTVADFAVLRFSRLYPAYWATLVLATGVSVLVFGRSFWLGGFVANATMLEDFLGYPRFDNIYWTLTVQIAFYMIAGFLFALGLHRRRLLFVVVWLVIAAIWVLMFQRTDIDHRHWLALLFALDFSPYFGMGIVLFDVTKHGWSAARAGVVVLAIATEFLIAGWVGLCVALIVAILFVLAIRGNLRFLVSKVTLWLGAISYALFLVHRNLGYESLDWLHEHHVSLAVAVPVTILGALAIATLVTYGVEKPALYHIRSWHHEWKTRRARASLFLFCLLVLTLFPSLSNGKEVPKIAVWDLAPRKTPEGHAQELTSFLRSEITKLKKYEVYSQENVRTLAESPATQAPAKAEPPAPVARTAPGEYRDSATGMEFLLVKGGCYQMGDTFGDGGDDEKPVHEVCVKDFYLGKYEVTQEQWKRVMGGNPSNFKESNENPVEMVSWDDAQEFIRGLNQMSGKSYRLATEAEWEYAARNGGKREKWAGTSNESELRENAWFSGNSGGKTQRVGQKRPNGLGLCDMSGNVWEWVSDWYEKDYYRNSPKNDPPGPSSGKYKVLRGGSWHHRPGHARAASRIRFVPSKRDIFIGFRVGLSPR